MPTDNDTTTHGDVWSGAVFSACERYRYGLWRRWNGPRRGTIAWIMLNPSTATHAVSDPTVTRCIERAKMLGYSGVDVVNLFAWRSTDPAGLKSSPAPVGPLNNQFIIAAATAATTIVVAWGQHGKYIGRARVVARLLKENNLAVQLFCLGVTKAGQPRHPLYIGYDVPLREWKV